jgi:hypothetical protein
MLKLRHIKADRWLSNKTPVRTRRPIAFWFGASDRQTDANERIKRQHRVCQFVKPDSHRARARTSLCVTDVRERACAHVDARSRGNSTFAHMYASTRVCRVTRHITYCQGILIEPFRVDYALLLRSRASKTDETSVHARLNNVQ